MVGGLIEAGAQCAGFDPRPATSACSQASASAFPLSRRARPTTLLDDPSIELIVCAGIPASAPRSRSARCGPARM
jgi:hypothetical protein